MNHGVAYRFAQYAHWLPYATRDMRYEDMAGAMHSVKIVFCPAAFMGRLLSTY